MKRAGSRLALPLAALLLGAMTHVGSAGAEDVRIEHVTVVSPERSRPLKDATVIVHDDRIVSVEAGRPSRASGTARVIDGRGLLLTPGLIDSHVHLDGIPGMRPQDEQKHPDVARAARAQIPRSFLLYGYTTLLDLMSTPQQMAGWRENDLRPDTLYCGATPVLNGYGMAGSPSVEEQFRRYPYILVQPGEESKAPAGADPAVHSPKAVVARMKADGASCVKAFAEDGFGPSRNIPMIRLEVATALVDEGHKAGLPVFMHANAADMQTFALNAGADVIAHGMWHWVESDDATTSTALGTVSPGVKTILDKVLDRRVGWQPTIQVLYGERDLFDPRYLDNPVLTRVYPASLIEWYRTSDAGWFRDRLARDGAPPRADGKPRTPEELWALAQTEYARPLSNVANATAYLARRGGRLLFGTDTPSAPSYANPPGLNGLWEMQRLVAAGMTPAQVFRAATLVNAQMLQLDRNIGTVQVGKRANLLLMREDPSRSVDAYAGIVKVIVGGRVIDAADLVANSSSKLR